MVCPPGLYITLGVFIKLYGLLEDECHNLDLELALHSSEDAHFSFSTCSQELQKLHLLHAEMEQVTDKVTATASCVSYQALVKVLRAIQNNATADRVEALEKSKSQGYIDNV